MRLAMLVFMKQAPTKNPSYALSIALPEPIKYGKGMRKAHFGEGTWHAENAGNLKLIGAVGGACVYEASAALSRKLEAYHQSKKGRPVLTQEEESASHQKSVIRIEHRLARTHQVWQPITSSWRQQLLFAAANAWKTPASERSRDESKRDQ